MADVKVPRKSSTIDSVKRSVEETKEKGEAVREGFKKPKGYEYDPVEDYSDFTEGR